MLAAVQQKEIPMKYHSLAIGMILCLSSCMDNSNSTTALDFLHSPVTTNVTNSFTFSIDANQFFDNSDHFLSFLSDSLVITLSSTGYSSGQAIIFVSDAEIGRASCRERV
jgi:hypothetical protein